MRHHRLPRALVVVVAAVTAVVGLVPSPAPAAVGGTAISVGRIGASAVAEPSYRADSRDAAQSVSADGRYVAFATDSGPSTDDNGASDIYLRDRRTSTTEAVSVAPDGRAGDGASINPSVSGDGRYVAFVSWATDLATDADGFQQDVFVRDRVRRTTVQVPGSSGAFNVQISADGGTVLWNTGAALYARDLAGGPRRTIVSATGIEASISGNGEWVAWASFFGTSPVYRTRVADGGTQLVSATPAGAARNALLPQIDALGTTVAFVSDATDIVSPATDGNRTFFVTSGLDSVPTTRVIAQGYAGSPILSADGRTATWVTNTALTAEDTDTAYDVYASTLPGGAPRLLSATHPPANPGASGRTFWSTELSGDGQLAKLISEATAGTGSATPAPRAFAVTTTTADEGIALVGTWFSRLFGRTMSATERSTRLAQLTGGSRTAHEVVIDDMRRDSFSGPRAGVVRLYQAYFLRRPDTGGYDFWVGRRRAGTSLDAISQAFAGSAEFRTLYGSLSDAQFVARVYENVLGRAPDAAGLAYWTGQLRSGARSRGQVMTGFSEAPENRVRTAHAVETTMLHRAARPTVPSATYMAARAARQAGGLGITAELTAIAADT